MPTTGQYCGRRAEGRPMAPESERDMASWRSPDEALREEANEIHNGPEIPQGVEGSPLRIALHAQHSSALCLSGGGIRSASFALGVIEALAVNPRPKKDSDREGDTQVECPD